MLVGGGVLSAGGAGGADGGGGGGVCDDDGRLKLTFGVFCTGVGGGVCVTVVSTGVLLFCIEPCCVTKSTPVSVTSSICFARITVFFASYILLSFSVNSSRTLLHSGLNAPSSIAMPARVECLNQLFCLSNFNF